MTVFMNTNKNMLSAKELLLLLLSYKKMIHSLSYCYFTPQRKLEPGPAVHYSSSVEKQTEQRENNEFAS